MSTKQPPHGFGSEQPAPPPAFPVPPPPEGGYGCPKCGSPHTSEAQVDNQWLVFAALNQTTCNACGYSFNGKTGKSTAPTMIALIAVPVLLVFGLGALFYWLSSR